MVLALQKVVRDRDLAADPSKERIKFWADSEKRLKQNLKILAKNVQKLAADLAKVCCMFHCFSSPAPYAFPQKWSALVLNMTGHGPVRPCVAFLYGEQA